MATIGSDVLADIVGNFYEAAYDEDRWQSAVDSLHQVWDGATICLALQDINTHCGIAIGGVDESYHRSYFEEYAPHNLVARAMIPSLAGTIFTNWNPVPRDVWFGSRFWNEWMAPQDLHHLLGAKIQLFGDVLGTLQIQRGRQRPDFDDEDVSVLQQLVPAITRAAYLGHRVGTLKLGAQTAQMIAGGQQVATLVVAADGRIIHLSQDADTFLARPSSGLSRSNSQLVADDTATSATLLRLIADACHRNGAIAPGQGGDLLVHSVGTAEPPMTTAVSVGPLADSTVFGVTPGPNAVIFLRAVTLALPNGFEDHARQLFDLTPAEARLAAGLASGMALKDAALHQGIRFSTARSYLEIIFRKTRTRQQSQLVALLKSTQPLIQRA
jgi:DNA-binding CsgD family transcriptional regulator